MIELESIILDFEKVTKYQLSDFLTTFRDFVKISYPEINKYFSGQSDSIDSVYLKALKNITSETKNVISLFKNFSNKFSSCGYWELLNLINDLEDTVEKINKLPKYRRTSLTTKGYKPMIQTSVGVGSYKTMEDIASEVEDVNGDNTSWVDLMLQNDLNEKDWEIDILRPIGVFLNNQNNIVVTTILDQPIGNRIYGIDINRKISFDGNDLSTVKYEYNLEQKIDILLNLTRGDVPENMFFGKSISLGSSVKDYQYSVLITDLNNNFLQNDLFDSIDISDFSFSEGNIQATCNIVTKYNSNTTKQISL